MEYELARLFRKVGLGDGNAQELADIVAQAIRDQESTTSVDTTEQVDVTEYIGDFGDMDEVDDAVGMAEALGHLATALINVKDALA